MHHARFKPTRRGARATTSRDQALRVVQTGDVEVTMADWKPPQPSGQVQGTHRDDTMADAIHG